MWVCARWKLPCTRGILGESHGAPGSLPPRRCTARGWSVFPKGRAAAADRGEQRCLVEGSSDDIPFESSCTLHGSVLSKVVVTEYTNSIARTFWCLEKIGGCWHDCKLKSVVLWRRNPLVWVREHVLAITFSTGTDACLHQLWFIGWGWDHQLCLRDPPQAVRRDHLALLLTSDVEAGAVLGTITSPLSYSLHLLCRMCLLYISLRCFR